MAIDFSILINILFFGDHIMVMVEIKTLPRAFHDLKQIESDRFQSVHLIGT